MENIILTNNKDLRLVGVKVGVLSTLRFELPLVSASATHVEVIVTSGNVHSAYTATFIDATKRWQCDIAASQFPTVGKQSYEIAYVLDGKQFWDGKGWIEIEDATTSGIEPQPRPEPYRYAVVSVNGYGADAQGAVRIPKTFIATDSPTTTEGYMEGDIYFNRETGATWTLCNVQGTLTWVFNYKNYYTKEQTDEAIDRVAAYYITYDAAGNPFPTRAALLSAQTVYSGGKVRTPTRNDYCVVLADETHDNAEYRYIYAVADGETTGSWQSQFPVEGVMTIDSTVTKNSPNPVASSGIWSALWGTASTAFSSLYDWVVSQLAGKADKSDVMLTPRYADEWIVNPIYPEGYTSYTGPTWSDHDRAWYILYHGDTGEPDFITIAREPSNALSLSFIDGTTATRQSTEHTLIGGYALGSQTDKPLASEAEAEALRTGKQNALTAQQLANIAAVSDALAFDATHSYAAGDPVVYNGTLYTFTATHTGAWTGSDVSAVDIIARLALKANDDAVVKLTGEPQTMSAVLQLLNTLYAEDGVESHGDYRLTWTVGGDYASALTISHDAISVQLAGENEPRQYKLQAGGGGTLALLENIAPEFVYLQSYDVDDLCTSFDADSSHMGTWLYKCIAATDGSTYPETDTTHWTLATVEDVLAALRTTLAGKADVSAIPYALVTKTITSGAVSLDDRASNSVTVSATLSPNTLTINFPTAPSGRVRDFGLRLNIAAGVTAPEIAWPQGVTLENNGGEVPEIADGGTGGSSTILYFSETENNGTTAKFLVKSETLTAIAQA